MEDEVPGQPPIPSQSPRPTRTAHAVDPNEPKEGYFDPVTQIYEMDPNTEDLLYGDELIDGMVVLVSEATDRQELVCVSELATEKRRIINRWCTVSKLRTEYDRHSGNVIDIHFVGIYAENEKHVRNAKPNQGWLVKKYSLPDEMEEDTVEHDVEPTSLTRALTRIGQNLSSRGNQAV